MSPTNYLFGKRCNLELGVGCASDPSSATLCSATIQGGRGGAGQGDYTTRFPWKCARASRSRQRPRLTVFRAARRRAEADGQTDGRTQRTQTQATEAVIITHQHTWWNAFVLTDLWLQRSTKTQTQKKEAKGAHEKEVNKGIGGRPVTRSFRRC